MIILTKYMLLTAIIILSIIFTSFGFSYAFLWCSGKCPTFCYPHRCIMYLGEHCGCFQKINIVQPTGEKSPFIIEGCDVINIDDEL